MRSDFGIAQIRTSCISTKRTFNFGAQLLVAGIVSISSTEGISCAQPDKEKETSPIELTGIWVVPYTGKVAQDENGAYYMANRFIVRFQGSIDKETVTGMIKDFNGSVTGVIPQLRLFEIETPENIESAMSTMKSKPGVENTSRNYFFDRATTWDNDEYYSEGKDYSQGLWWSKSIELTNGLNLLVASGVSLKPVNVAVIDMGFDLGDIEIPYVNKKYHYDFADSDGDVSADEDLTRDGYAHGNLVASFIGAINNGLETNGVASAGKSTFGILPLKVHSTSGGNGIPTLYETLFGDDYRVAAALQYIHEEADELNIKAVNMSFGRWNASFLYGYSTQLAIYNLIDKGIIPVAAAGNGSTDDISTTNPLDACKFYPSAFDKVISVAATSIKYGKEKRASFSNYSNDTNCMEICAPGEDILVFNSFGVASLQAGTSLASPMVAGLVALIKSIKPDMPVDEVKDTLRMNADDIDLSDDPVTALNSTTWKRINVGKTIQYVLQTDPGNQTISCIQLTGFGIGEYFLNSGKIASSGAIYDISSGTRTPAPSNCTLRAFIEGKLICETSSYELNVIDISNNAILRTIPASYHPNPNFDELAIWKNFFVFRGYANVTEDDLYLVDLSNDGIQDMGKIGSQPAIGNNHLAYVGYDVPSQYMVSRGDIKLYDVPGNSTFSMGGPIGENPRIYGDQLVYNYLEVHVVGNDILQYSLQVADISNISQPISTVISQGSMNANPGPSTTADNVIRNYGISGDYVAFQDPSSPSDARLYSISQKSMVTAYHGAIMGSFYGSPPSVQIGGKQILIFTNSDPIICSF